MKIKPTIPALLFLAMIAAACGPKKAVFDIYGSPNPLFYGGLCPTPVLTLLVSGPGDGLRINSIIAAYQLFDGAGKKVDENTASLHPVPDAPSVAYDASRIITVPYSGGSAPSPDSPILDFGEGRVDFAATVYAKILSPSPGSLSETYYFTSTKSIPVLPCSSLTPTPAPIKVTIAPGPGLPGLSGAATIIPPGSYAKPTPVGGAAPPSCSVGPNNPNCQP